MAKGLICAICGKARAGKDTFGKMLSEELFERTGKRFILMAYATELKKRVQADFDLDYEQLWGDEKEMEDGRYPKKEGGFWTGREIMQFMGTECFRAVDNDFWVRTLFNVIDDKEFENVIITDVRFPNEADPVVEREGYIIKIDRDIEEYNVHGQTHASETAMDNYNNIDFTVSNYWSFDELRQSAKDVAEFLLSNEKLKRN